MPAVDHAAFAWDDLEEIERRFADVGLEPAYGGVHGDGTTEMSMLGFDDGSYLELIAATDIEEPLRRWPDEIRARAGPCAWCLEVDDVGGALKRLIDRGVPVEGPHEDGRERPDGVRIEWEMGVYGADEVSQLLPFLIADRTPRSYRVRPTESVSGGPLTGVARVVLAVGALEPRVELLRRLSRYPTPRRGEDDAFGARLAAFPGRPAILAEPAGENWIAERLDRFREAPCAYLIGTDDLDAAAGAYPLSPPTEWFGRRVAWFEGEGLGRRLGVIEE